MKHSVSIASLPYRSKRYKTLAVSDTISLRLHVADSLGKRARGGKSGCRRQDPASHVLEDMERGLAKKVARPQHNGINSSYNTFRLSRFRTNLKSANDLECNA